MAVTQEIKIVLQVGTELRVNDRGEVVISNPKLELARQESAADAVLLYRFDPETREHISRLAEPVADHKHMKEHRRDDQVGGSFAAQVTHWLERKNYVPWRSW